VIKVLAASGVLRPVQTTLDALIEEVKAGTPPTFPTLTVSAEKAVNAAGFANPYAAAKAYAALTMAETVSAVTAAGCFQEQDPARYVTMVAAGHEMMRAAARLADEARELEKAADSLLRTPHAANGAVLRKTQLNAKPG